MLALHLSLCLLLLVGSFATKKPVAQPVNINTTTSAQLQLVPGIGPSNVEKILQMRKSYRAFKSVNDLTAIRGTGPKRLEKTQRYLTVGKSAARAPNTAQPTSCPGCAKTKPHATTKSAATQKTPTPPSSAQPDTEDEEP